MSFRTWLCLQQAYHRAEYMSGSPRRVQTITRNHPRQAHRTGPAHTFSIWQCVQLKANIGLNITSAHDREVRKALFASHAGIAITAATAWPTTDHRLIAPDHLAASDSTSIAIVKEHGLVDIRTEERQREVNEVVDNDDYGASRSCCILHQHTGRKPAVSELLTQTG